MRTKELTVTLRGIAKIGSVPDWEGTTSEFFEGGYREERPGGFYNVMMGVTKANATVIGGGGSHECEQRDSPQRIVGRHRGGSVGVGDAIGGRGSGRQVCPRDVVPGRRSDWEPYEDFALFPLSTESRRDEYVGRPKSFLGGYEYLTDVSEISVVAPTPSRDAVAGSGGGEGSGGGGAGAGAVVRISVAGAAAPGSCVTKGSDATTTWSI
jgi:hypothetical protein